MSWARPSAIPPLESSFRTPPNAIILCTGYSETVNEQSAKHYGITRFLMKPVNTKDLAWAVHEALSARSGTTSPDN